MGTVKRAPRAVWDPSTSPASGKKRIPSRGPRLSDLIQESTMADPAFVAITIALFAVVALVAKGVAKL